jgi:chromosome segregation ATPase
MKNFQQNLLMFLALGLCALCAWQWYVQTLLHNEGAALQRTIFNQATRIQDYTNSIKNMDAEIAGLSTRINELKQTALTNEQAAAEQKLEILRLRSAGEGMSNQIVQYKEVVDKLEAQLKEASEGIQKQNDAIKQLIAARDDAIKKYNDSMKERNALAEKYNDLVERYNKLQAAAAAAASGGTKQ